MPSPTATGSTSTCARSRPRDGLIPALIGLKRPIDLTIEGDGSWTRWRGTARIAAVGRSTRRSLALAADSGRYRLSGTLAPAPFLKGRLQRLTAPPIKVDGDATFEDRILDGRLTLVVAVAARGGERRDRPWQRALSQGQPRASTCFARRRCSPT